MPIWYFAQAQDDMNLCILRMCCTGGNYIKIALRLMVMFTIGVTLTMHNTHVRNMRKKIYNKVILN